MQAFTPKKSTSDSGHPGDEELAAYVDGVLEGEEKARVVEHLASCADCYRVYSETLRFQLEEGEEEQEREREVAAAATATVVSFPSERKGGRPRPWWVAAAAVLVIGLGAGLFTLFAPSPVMTTAELVAPVQDEPQLGAMLWLDKATRGPNDPMPGPNPESLPDDPSFRIGVQIVNLQWSLEAGQPKAALEALPRLNGLLKENLIPLPKPLVDHYINLGSAIDKGQSPRSFAGAGVATSEDIRDFVLDPSLFDLGRFVEAGRLAAIAREPAFFNQRDTRRMLRQFIKHQEKGELDLDPESLKSLKAISERLKDGELKPSDYSTLREQFEVILKVYYPT